MDVLNENHPTEDKNNVAAAAYDKSMDKLIPWHLLHTALYNFKKHQGMLSSRSNHTVDIISENLLQAENEYFDLTKEYYNLTVKIESMLMSCRNGDESRFRLKERVITYYLFPLELDALSLQSARLELAFFNNDLEKDFKQFPYHDDDASTFVGLSGKQNEQNEKAYEEWTNLSQTMEENIDEVLNKLERENETRRQLKSTLESFHRLNTCELLLEKAVELNNLVKNFRTRHGQSLN